MRWRSGLVGMSVIGEAPVLNEVDDTSSLKTERNPGHRRPLLSQPAQSEADRVSGLSRSDLVLWLKAEVQARLIDVRLCTDNRH